MDLRSYLYARGKLFWGIVGFILVFLMGAVDYLTGSELSVYLFYLAPIGLVAWFGGTNLSFVVATGCAIVWIGVDYLGGVRYAHNSIYFWNTLIRLGSFWVVSLLISALRRAYQLNQDNARTDFVTGAVSGRYFYELAETEMNRFRRYKNPFSLVYIDLDNFKGINDRLGHITGDKLLRVFAGNIQKQIRTNDILTRLGGDEFAILLPQTDEKQVKQIMSRLHSNLSREMLSQGWMITFSVGVVTYKQAPRSVDEMVRQADTAMYAIKTASKNGVSYNVYSG